MSFRRPVDDRSWLVSIFVACECGRRFEMPDELAGLRVRCPSCGRETELPDPASPESWLLPNEPGPTETSWKAVLSVTLGGLFFFAFLSGAPAILLGYATLREIGRTKGRIKDRRMANAGIVLGMVGCLFTFVYTYAFFSVREAARRALCSSNLKQIGYALHHYHDDHGVLPAAAIADEEGRPLLSWRVALLPYIDQAGLYARFHLDEPWNSPHNYGLIRSMPEAFACPSDREQDSGMTGYQAVVGCKTVFTPDYKPLRILDVADGAYDTLSIVETLRAVPWTKPEDLSFDDPSPLHGMGSRHGHHGDGFHASFVDGSIRFLTRSIPPKVLDALLTRNGGEVISPDAY
jgi:hypothetical protein